MGRLTRRTRVTRVAADGQATTRADTVIVEEPLEIRLGGDSTLVTMRTPGHDIELLHGLLLAEGVIRSAEDVITAAYCAGSVATGELGLPENTYNLLDVTLRDPAAGARLSRATLTSASCGVCGKASIDELATKTAWPVAADPLSISAELLGSLPSRLRSAQPSFGTTGGVHAAALFDADGKLLVAREDVGRHNAVDKVIGERVLAGAVPAVGTVLMVSGRVSFELVQKAVMAGIPCLAAVSAPSSLAVETAQDAGMTLAGFVRDGRFNLYAGEHRVTLP